MSGRAQHQTGGGGELLKCSFDRVEVDPEFLDSVITVVHELAHLYDLVWEIEADHPEVVGALELYFGTTYSDTSGLCDNTELLADALSYLVLPDTTPWYWSRCTTTPSTPDAALVTLLESVVAGQVPAWFTTTYGNDPVQVWSAVDQLSMRLGVPAVGHLRNMFGGYCSEADATWSGLGAGTDTNPWSEGGGCLPSEPRDLLLTAGDPLAASWTAPLHDGGKTITGYEVQWREQNGAYDGTPTSTRRATVTGLTHQMAGLTSGTVHYVRVRAINAAGVGAWSDETSL